MIKSDHESEEVTESNVNCNDDKNSASTSLKGVKRTKSVVSSRRLKFNNPELKAVRVRVEKLQNR